MAKKLSYARYETVKISKIKHNPDNPRYIDEISFKRLIDSITELPKMLEVKPICVNEDYMVIGGNQRLEAMLHLGYEECHIVVAVDWTPEELEQYVIKDNTHFGQWVFSMLNKDDMGKLEAWGMDIGDWQGQQFKPTLNPSIDPSTVTPEDIQKAEKSNAIVVQQNITRNILCPHCLESFDMTI